MPERDPAPSAKTGKELRQFFTELLDETKLRDYHANPEGYVEAQKEKGVLSDEASRLILDRDSESIEANIELAPDSTRASKSAIVFPPL